MRIVKMISLIGFLIFNLMFNVIQEKEPHKSIDKISIGVVDLPEELAYSIDESYVSNVIMGNLFEGLVNLSSSGDIVSAIAERYSILDNGLTYKFFLRNDVYFSNGDPITSKDFVKFFKEILSKDDEKIYYEDLKNIVGVEEYYKGVVTFDEVGIKSDKRNCLIIELKEKDDNFLKTLTQDKYSLRNDFKYLHNYKDFYEYINYTGAYVINDIVKKDNENLKIILKPNQYYYLNNYKTVDERVYSFADNKEIILEVFPTREFAIESYKSGKLNFVLDVPYNSLKNHFESKDLYYVYNDSSNLVFNLDEFQDEEKIAEVSLSLEDEEENKITKGNFIDFILDKGDARYINGIDSTTLQKYIFNKDYIAKELEKYNFEEVKMLKIVTHSDDNYIELAREFKDFLKDEFEISSNIVAFDDEYIENTLKESEYDILITSLDVEENGIDFDKPQIILSNIDLSRNYLDGNGTIIFSNIN